MSPGESLSILLQYTGLQYLRIYYSLNIRYLYFAKLKCYFRVTDRDLAVIISKMFTELLLPAYFTSFNYVQRVVKDTNVRSQVSYIGSPQEDIAYHLVAVSNGVLDLNTISLLEDPSPELFCN